MATGTKYVAADNFSTTLSNAPSTGGTTFVLGSTTGLPSNVLDGTYPILATAITDATYQTTSESRERVVLTWSTGTTFTASRSFGSDTALDLAIGDHIEIRTVATQVNDAQDALISAEKDINTAALTATSITTTGGGSLTGTWTSLGTVTTMDLNGGTIDGTTIGGSSAGAGTFTTLNASGGGALTGTWTNLGSVTTIDINGGTIDGTTIGGSSAGAGTFTTLNATGGGALTGTWSNLGSVTTIDINGGTIDGTVIGGTTRAAGSFTSLNANAGGALTGTWSNLGSVTTIDINGGTIDGTTVGASSASTGAFTTLSASSGLTVSSGNVGVTSGNLTLTSGNLTLTAGTANMGGAVYKKTTFQNGTTYTVQSSDYLIVGSNASNITVTLPAVASSGGRELQFININASGSLIIDGNGSETINGATTKTLTNRYDSCILRCDGSPGGAGTAWYVVSGNTVA